MKISGAILAIFMTIILVLTGCSSKAGSAAPKTQISTVQRGDISVEITAAGNLALSRTEDLAFQVTSTQAEPVTVDQVNVEAGDPVKEGQVLATIDVNALKDRVTNRERTLNQAQLSFKNAETSLVSSQVDLQTAKDNQDGIRSAQITLETATINFNRLNYPFNYSTFAFDVPTAIDQMRSARQQLESAQEGLTAGPESAGYATALDQFRKAQYNLTQALERLAKGLDINVYDGGSVSSTVSNYLTARDKKIAMDDAQVALDKAKKNYDTAVEKAQLTLDRSKVSLEQSKLSLGVAQEEVDTANAYLKNSNIVAPFTGFVSKVNVKGGDEVKKGTVAVQVADPNKFEANIMVSEMDIFHVKLGGKASVQVSAMPSLIVSANVTSVSPTATIQSGVVNYQVKVELESLEAIRQRLQTGQPGTTPRAPGAPGGTTRPGATPKPQRSGQAPTPTAAPETLQLRDGLTVTVAIQVSQGSNVLLVPNTAITQQGTQTTVKVSQNGGTEERVIKTGISNWQYTEVTDGLSEGEKIVVPQGATKSTSSSSQQPQQGGIRIPGIGGMIR